MNILITAIGSMSAEAVIASIREHYLDAKIIGTDINPAEWHWITKKVDAFYNLVKANNKTYINDLVDICIKEDIDMVIPLTDPEVDVLSENISELSAKGIKVAISNSKTIEIVRDKYQLAQFFANYHEIRVIPTFKYHELNLSNIDFPIVAKVNNGRSSEGLRFLENLDELKAFKSKAYEYIFQPKLVGPVITVDIVGDSNGNVFSVARVERIRTSNGAGLSIEVIQNKTIDDISNFLALKLNLLGCMNYELLHHNDNFYLMDINPRFSAGVSFSKLAGYDFVYNSIEAILGNPIQLMKSVKNIKAFKKYEDIIL